MPAVSRDTLTAALDAFVTALLEHDEPRAREVVERALDDGAGVRAVYLEILQPALYEVGERWADGRISVADEHHASATTDRIRTLLAERLRVPPRDGRLAVVACTPGELHAIGAHIVADFLEGEAWEVLRLGASMPAAELAALIERERPDVVALSTAMASRLEDAADVLRELARVRPRPFVVVGGLGWRGPAAARASDLGADLVVEDAGTLVELLAARFPPVADDR